ncbi:Panacea domain-containing protein [uncultured Helicobacter sp.]|uniref:Panacea domain-containing protein n=1 Tax=uncultured Helicobacter sp. TaxID=175537 RepID=UPI00374FA89A
MQTLKAYDVALYFLFRARELEAGDTISNLKMQKLLYYAQGHFLAIYQTPLFSERIEAWKYGPVVKEVYDRFKKYGNLAIDFEELDNFNSTLYTSEHLDTLPFVFNRYNISAKELVDKTHSESPWMDAYSKYTTNEISQQSIQDFFTQRFKQEAQSYAR